MDAASTSEPSANFYKPTQRNNPAESHFHYRRRENLKSLKQWSVLMITDTDVSF
jgi:hypothetical protein